MDEGASPSSSSAAVAGGRGGSEGGGGGVDGVERGLRAPFWGKSWSSEEVEDELAEWAPWLDVRDLDGVEVGGWVGVGCCAPILERACCCGDACGVRVFAAKKRHS